ncbi:hypothetical protein [Lachnoclostridium phytofermentans]|jgi:hypothetical protein|uniref:hypothetical protein n=1 Tax=Lachnoclostridium phytofermentans TaxID=66219 RepID=UPI0004974E60|nr:hypothetical protein [Lachnoclostridium phytofermentans]
MIKLPRLKRKWRIIRNLVLISLLLLLCFIVVDFASFSPVDAFRKMEKAYLSGPSEILVISEDPSSFNTKIVLATYQDYIQVGTIDKNYHLWKGRNLFSYKSHGDITVIPHNSSSFHNALIFVATNMKEPMRAELSINFEYIDRNEKKETNTYTYEGIRETDGVYSFHIVNQKEPKFEWERDDNLEHLIFTLGLIADFRTNIIDSYPIQLRFYSETGEIVLEEDLELNWEYLYGK